MTGDRFRPDPALRAVGSANVLDPPRPIIDIFVLGLLRRLQRGDLRHDGVTDQEREGLHVLTAKGLATFGEQPEPRVSPLSWRITEKGIAAL